MDNPTINSKISNTLMTNQPTRKLTNQNDLLAKIRPLPSNKPNLVQHLTQSNPISISSGLNTRIQSNGNLSYQPLVTISDDNTSDEDAFSSPIHKLTKTEIHEDSIRNETNHALLAADDDDDTADIEFRTHQSIKRFICCYQYPLSFKDTYCTIS